MSFIVIFSQAPCPEVMPKLVKLFPQLNFLRKWNGAELNKLPGQTKITVLGK